MCVCVCVFCVCVCVLCVCSLRYPACSAHAPYGVASLAVQYFPTLSHKWHDFRINVIEDNFLFSYSLQLRNISHSEKN